MIITQTPLRISFFGGGTDYPDYFKVHGGETLAATIDRCTMILVNPTNELDDYAFRVQYSKMETLQSLDDIQHPSARECLRFLQIRSGVEIHYFCDLPVGAGLASSSSATVGLLHGLHAHKGDAVSNEELAKQAVFVEQEMIRERVGCQDQYICAVGGFVNLRFDRSGSVTINRLSLPSERVRELEQRLILIYTGATRTAHDLLDEQFERTRSGENTATFEKMKPLVDEGIRVLSGQGSLDDFGHLLHETWRLKRELSNKIATPWIDDAYEAARNAGARGGKLLGAGGGGFLLFYVEPRLRERVLSALAPMPHVSFNFESDGTRAVFSRERRRDPVEYSLRTPTHTSTIRCRR